MTNAVEKLMNDVAARVQSLKEGMITVEQVKTLFNDMMNEALKNPEITSKLIHQESPSKIQGTKFARHNLTIPDVEFLYDLQKSLKGLPKGHGEFYAGPSEELENTFKAISDALYLSADQIKAIDRQAIDNMFPRISKANEKAYEAAIKSMDSAESGAGSQLIGAQYVPEMWDSMRRGSKLAGLLQSFEMTAPTAYLPVPAAMPEMLFQGESTSSSQSNYTTSPTGSNRVTVAAKKFICHQVWSTELEEDAIIPFIPFLRQQLAESLAYYTDSIVLNGDDTNAGTGNINLDDADPADTKHYLAFDGVRHAGLVDNTANSKDLGANRLTYNDLIDQRGRMNDATYNFAWGHPSDPADLIRVCDPDTADQISKLDEVKTVDKYGDKATVLAGEIAQIGRSPLIAHAAMSKTEADGKVSTTAGNNIYGQLVALNRRGFVLGYRRRVQLALDTLVRTDQKIIVMTTRFGLGRFSPTGAASGIECADVIYDIAL